MKEDVELTRLRRRRLLGMLGATGAVGVTGCLGGDEGDNGNGADGDEGGNGEDGGAGEDSRGPEDEYRPSDFDFEPEDGFQDDHPDVEIPDEPGNAVLIMDGERIEFDDLDEADGGPLSGSALDMYVDEDEDEFAGPGPYFSLQVGFSSESHSNSIFMGQGFVGGFDVLPGYFRSDQFNILTPEGEDEIRYWEYPDGTVREEDTAFASYLQSPFVRVDREGVVTAKAEPQDAAGDGELESGFEFGANIGEDWYE